LSPTCSGCTRGRMRRRASPKLSLPFQRSQTPLVAPTGRHQTERGETTASAWARASLNLYSARREEDTMESTRRIVMFNWMTANGYFAGADGNLDWVVPDQEQAKAAAEAIPLFDTALFGRRTYELFEKFWSHAVEDSSTAPDPHQPGQRTLEHRAIAKWLNEMTKLVFSRSLKDATWQNSRILHEFEPREIETMKRQPGKDMIG